MLVHEVNKGKERVLKASYQPAFERNYLAKSEGGAGWALDKQALKVDYDKPPKTYPEHVELLRQWLIDRIAWLDAEFERIVSNSSLNE